jgi:hypothetical protein
VEDKPRDRTVGGDVEGGGGTDAAGFENDGFVSTVPVKLVISGQRGRPNRRESGTPGEEP